MGAPKKLPTLFVQTLDWAVHKAMEQFFLWADFKNRGLKAANFFFRKKKHLPECQLLLTLRSQADRFRLSLPDDVGSRCGVAMEARHRILVVDDDADWLDVCRELMSQLPSKPEIRTVGAGARAIAQLDSQPFRLMICDLKMPKMDGLQVLSIVRRRFPDLRTVVLTGMEGEEYRSRAYSLGVDLFWLKSDMQQNTKLFMDCVESLLGKEINDGFRGIQSKSLMDIIQLECMSRNSTVLRITRGPLVAKIWIQDGELLDAMVGNVRGEAAFQKILAWKSGTFESLPPEPNHERTIERSINALLLETAQTIDETSDLAQTEMIEKADHRKTVWRLALLAAEGAEWVVTVPPEGGGKNEAWGTHDGDQYGAWIRTATEAVKRLGDRMEAGPLSHITCASMERKLIMVSQNDKTFVVAWPPQTEDHELLEKTKKLVASWDS